MKAFLLLLIFLLGINNAYAEEELRAGYGKTCLVTKTLSVNELKSFSGIVFRGEYLGSEYKEQKGLMVRELRFKVKDPIKGISPDKKNIALNEWAMIKSPFSEKTVKQGKEYVFFFHTPSPRDLTSLIGLEQGLVKIEDNGRVRFSKRLKMSSSSKLKSKVVTTVAQKEEVNIQTYSELKSFFQ